MNTLYITTGNIGSGKTTWARFFAGRQMKQTYIIDADAIRTMLHGGFYVFNPDIECHIKDSLLDLTSLLLLKADVIIDGLNHTSLAREKIIKKIKAECNSVSVMSVVFPPHIKHLERRISEPRGYSVGKWRDVYNEISAAFEFPKISEGFDFILQVDDVFEFIEIANFKG